MGLVAWLKKRWKRFRYVVQIDGSPYLVRYRLIDTKRLGVYLHHILRDDNERCLHDHPFDFTTFILWGGYYEWALAPSAQPLDQIYYPRYSGEIVRHKAEDLHRITLRRDKHDRPRRAWTLFIRGPRTRNWGFFTTRGWMDEKIYHQATDEERAVYNGQAQAQPPTCSPKV